MVAYGFLALKSPASSASVYHDGSVYNLCLPRPDSEDQSNGESAGKTFEKGLFVVRAKMVVLHVGIFTVTKCKSLEECFLLSNENLFSKVNSIVLIFALHSIL